MLRSLICLVLCITATAASATGAVLVNQVVNHPSPYLALHGEDPVHWQTWSREALEKARKLNRPILVSIGYFSCHWCHVMQRESYQDEELAKLLNEGFIPVKVDRELAPALDAHLIEFVELTQGQAGWPLNVFLTPDGYPVVGTTYLPRDRFFQLLEHLQERWRSEPALLRNMARDAMTEWRQIREAETGRKSAMASAATGMLIQTDEIKDELAGGFGQQSKFPMVSQLRALLWIRNHREDKALDEFIRLTLDRMADQGLHDVLGGGFFRYVTDPAWQVPHFEKMLYDNAQLAVLYLQAADIYQSSRYRATGLETLNFLLQEMWNSDGYFISSFSAVDAQGREGFYYVWDEAELKKLLNTDQLKAVQAAWFGDHPEATEYGRLPRWQGQPADIARRLGWSEEKLQTLLSSAQAKLLDVRSRRGLLADDKGLAAWNGLALSALAAGYAATGDARYEQHAEKLAAYIVKRLWDGQRLIRAIDGEQPLAEATLEDYALVAQGLWDWSRQKPKQDYQPVAEKLVRIAWSNYFVEGRWVQSDTPLIPMMEGRLALDESSLPSATATVTRLSIRDRRLRKDGEIYQQAQQHLEQVRTYLGDSMFWYPSYVELLDTD